MHVENTTLRTPDVWTVWKSIQPGGILIQFQATEKPNGPPPLSNLCTLYRSRFCVAKTNSSKCLLLSDQLLLFVFTRQSGVARKSLTIFVDFEQIDANVKKVRPSGTLQDDDPLWI